MWSQRMRLNYSFDSPILRPRSFSSSKATSVARIVLESTIIPLRLFKGRLHLHPSIASSRLFHTSALALKLAMCLQLASALVGPQQHLFLHRKCWAPPMNLSIMLMVQAGFPCRRIQRGTCGSTRGLPRTVPRLVKTPLCTVADLAFPIVTIGLITHLAVLPRLLSQAPLVPNPVRRGLAPIRRTSRLDPCPPCRRAGRSS